MTAQRFTRPQRTSGLSRRWLLGIFAALAAGRGPTQIAAAQTPSGGLDPKRLPTSAPVETAALLIDALPNDGFNMNRLAVLEQSLLHAKIAGGVHIPPPGPEVSEKLAEGFIAVSKAPFALIFLVDRFAMADRTERASYYEKAKGQIVAIGLKRTLEKVFRSVRYSREGQKVDLRHDYDDALFILIGPGLRGEQANVGIQDALGKAFGGRGRRRYVLAIDREVDDVVPTLNNLAEIVSGEVSISDLERLVPRSRFFTTTVEYDGSPSDEEIATARLMRDARAQRFSQGPQVVASAGSDYTVWFCTNRKPAAPAKRSVATYSGTRGSSVSLGRCKVFVPKSHTIGSTGSNLLRRVFTWTDDRLRLLEVINSTSDVFWDEIRQACATGAREDPLGMVFVHGYNVSFEDAALRSAQMGYDLGFPGPVAFCSWPSKGELSGYLADAASVEASEQMLLDFIQSFASRSGAKRLVIVAHSMGNRGLLRAFSQIAQPLNPVLKNSQLVLAAPDVDAEVFIRLAEPLAKQFAGLTLYVSDKDRALELSGQMHAYRRAGLSPPVTIVAGGETVYVGEIDISLLGHGYVASARDLLYDIHALVLDRLPAARRMALKERLQAGQRYWVIAP